MSGTRRAPGARPADPDPPKQDEELAYRLGQESALADFGRRALEEPTLEELLDHTARLCAAGMRARFSKAMEFLPDRNMLLLRAGVGWPPGVVGRETLDLESPAGFAFRTGKPIVHDHGHADERVRTPTLLEAHGVKRTVSAPVPLGRGKCWGALCAHSTDETGRWDEADLEFMTGMARLLGVAIDRLDARGQAEKSHASLHTLVDSVDQMIWTARPDGFVDFFNSRWYEYTGAPHGSTDGDAWAELFHPEDRARTFARWRRSLESGEPYEIEYRLRHRSGTYRWVLGRAHAVRDRVGEIIRWMGTCTDIHAQKADGERFRLLYQAQRTAHLVLAPDFTIEEVSDGYLQTTMTRREDLVGKNLFEIAPEDASNPDAGAVRNLRASLERVLARRAPDRMPVQKHDIRRPDGQPELRWWSPLNVPVFGPDGEIRHIIHQVEDVTAEMLEREKAAEARAGEARFRAVADAVPGLVFETDAEGRNTFVNEQYRAYTGLPIEALLGEGWRQVFHPEDLQRAAETWPQAARSGRAAEVDCRIRRADGAWRWFMLRTSPLYDVHGRLVKGMGICTDITHQREAMELQRTLLHELSHRVKNSLALVSSLLNLQARTVQDSARRALEEASSRVQTVAQVHDQLWRGAATREIDLQQFLCNLCRAIASAAPQFPTVCEAGPVIVSADLAVPLGLLVNELLTNAYKHAYPEDEPGEVKVIGNRVGERLYRLEVSDRGRGLPPGFDLVKARESLGMRVITSLAAQVGGELTAGSAEPGARFSLVFPLKAA